ncbi:MAG: hypothetical protein A3F17_09180 [Gammaproteobacteria bacterium RIFCSPHIGHO2_12_FULL_41_15]|nr:MAG: hypothetical protein A3F17_09180 [Gammaproteobacteria bacterium RIFCSPHIGHO2_12_FULL_41_15]
MQQLIDNQKVLLDAFQRKAYISRDLYQDIDSNHRLTALVGSRGVGKTTYLLHKALTLQNKNIPVLYISADNIYFLDHKLLDLIDNVYKETDIRHVLIDEIHKYENWNQELKNIYDIYLEMNIVFTGSSMIDIIKSKYDLSRRVIMRKIHGLSFREYLQFKLGAKTNVIKLEDIITAHVKLASKLAIHNILKHFNDYLTNGYYPFFIEFNEVADFQQAVENSFQKTIYEDIASSKKLKTPTLLILEKLFKYVVSSSAGELNANKLASHLQKDFTNISEYLSILHEAGLIRFLHRNKSGKSVLRNPEKMLPNNTNMMMAINLVKHTDDMRGKLRETFLLSQLQNAGHHAYLPTKGDFIVDHYTFEVGGKSKTAEQINHIDHAFLLADGIEVGFGNKIPLYLFGFLY